MRYAAGLNPSGNFSEDSLLGQAPSAFITDVSTIGPKASDIAEWKLDLNLLADREQIRKLGSFGVRQKQERSRLHSQFGSNLFEDLILDMSSATSWFFSGISLANLETTIIPGDAATLNSVPFIAWEAPQGERPFSFYISPPSRPLLFQERFEIDSLPQRLPTPVLADYSEQE